MVRTMVHTLQGSLSVDGTVCVCVCLSSSQPESYLLRDINRRQSIGQYIYQPRGGGGQTARVTIYSTIFYTLIVDSKNYLR